MNGPISEPRAYIGEHHGFDQPIKGYPDKHSKLLSRIKYTRKKINDGILEEWMVRPAHQPRAVSGSGEYEGYEGALWRKAWFDFARQPS